MSKLNRRNFIKSLAITGVAASTTGLSTNASAMSKEKKSTKIVVLGGGYGGSTFAKYMKMSDPSLDVTLVDKNDAHVSCAVSNEVIFGFSPLSKITFPHSILVDKYDIKFKKATVTGLDAANKTVKTDAGDIMYDKLVVSPGIAYQYDEKINYTPDTQSKIPASWIGGPETVKLRDMVAKIKKGDTIIMRTPKAIYRCPPGPYERSCLFALKAKEAGAKVIILDPNPKIMSKAPLFAAAFKDLYSDTLTYITDVETQYIDADNMTIKTNKGTFKGDLINYVPDQRAADMAFDLGLVPEGLLWAPINPQTFESTVVKDVYVIGDAIYTQIATAHPKSGLTASGMGQVLASNMLRTLRGEEVINPVIGNSCYSLVSDTEAIWVATIYEYNPATKKIEVKNKANGIPKAASVENYNNLHSWVTNFFQNVFH